MLTPQPAPPDPLLRLEVMSSGFLLLLWYRGQKSACTILIFLQEVLHHLLRKLHILQLLQKLAVLFWKTKAHWRKIGGHEVTDCVTGSVIMFR